MQIVRINLIEGKSEEYRTQVGDMSTKHWWIFSVSPIMIVSMSLPNIQRAACHSTEIIWVFIVQTIASSFRSRSRRAASLESKRMTTTRLGCQSPSRTSSSPPRTR